MKFVNIIFLILSFSVSSSVSSQAQQKEHLVINGNVKPVSMAVLKTMSRFINPEKTKSPKILTLMIYISADNDLHIFAWKNIRQLAEIAPENTNIIVFLTEPGKNKKTQIYLIEKNKSILLNKDNSQKLDSGDHRTLSDFCAFCIKNYPADNYGLILWNHGTGILDPFRRNHNNKIANASELFSINPATIQLEIDRTISFIEYISENENMDKRGICFDDTHGTYLTNQKMELALKNTKENALNNRPFFLIGMDACLMAMIEVASALKNYARYMVSSQEIELGAGWRYDKIMKFFPSNSNLEQFPAHMVSAYKDAYEKITPDYTLSAIDLEKIDTLEQCISELATALIAALSAQQGSSVKSAIKISKEKIGFDEPSYIDIKSFCEKLIKNISYMSMYDNESAIKAEIIRCATNCINATKATVSANTAGRNIQYANGISIYFPERSIHSSYERTSFAATNNWFRLLLKYINS